MSAEPTEGGGSLHADISGLNSAGVEILETESLHTLLNALAARGLSSLLVEGGAGVARSFLDAGLVDRILLFGGGVTVGEGGIESPVTHSDMPKRFRLVRSSSFGADRVHEYERSS
jgi:diaminohydroxyphosphoribosylaminopyrimidine deaminase/5-amino-6-(5-phosphoribosylamino)uracil reductase